MCLLICAANNLHLAFPLTDLLYPDTNTDEFPDGENVKKQD